MPHRRYVLGLEDRAYPGTASRAFGRVLLRTLGAVVLLTALWAYVVQERLLVVLHYGHVSRESVYERMATMWGFEWTGALPADALSFFVTRVESPWVVGPLLAAGLLAIVLEYRRKTAGV